MKIEILVLAALSVVATTAFPAGLRVAFMDSFATGRGNAFAATADNPSAIFYNPAGLTQLDQSELAVGAYAIQFSSQHTAPDGETTKMRDEFQPVPNFYYAHQAKNAPWAFGIGAYLPFGLVTEWPDDAPFRSLATRSELAYLRINPVLSYQINPQLSIGAGPTFNYSEIELRQGIPNVPGQEYRIEGDGSAIGFNAGLRWQPQRQHAFGIAYHSPTRVRFKGSDEAQIAAHQGDASFDALDFPEIVIAGYSYRPTPEWNFEVNIDWTRWSRFDSTTIRSEFPAASDQELPLEWESTFFYGAGATRYLGNHHFMSAGYLYAEQTVPAETFNPFLPDTELHFFSLGFGSTGKTFTWQGAYQYAHGPSRDVSRAESDGSDGGGRYRNHIHSLTLTLALQF